MWSSTVATTFSRSHSHGFLYLRGEMKCLVYETPIDTPKELVARVAEAAAIIRERQSFARRYRLCTNVNGRHFQQLLLNHPTSNPSRTPSEKTENLSDVCHITKGFVLSPLQTLKVCIRNFFTLCIFYPLL